MRLRIPPLLCFWLCCLLLLPIPQGPFAQADHAQAPGGDLSRFPRPTNDNGRGIHWVPTLFGQSTDLVDRFLGEADQLGVRWIKVMQPDQAKVEHVYLLHSMVQRGMMPVLRVYKQYNTPYEHLGALVKAAQPLGVSYYELYNEPNIAGDAGGWADNAAPEVDAIAAVWLPAAREVITAGGFPSLPSLSPGGSYDDLAFLRAFLRRVKQLGGGAALGSSWVALHNYSLNHPLEYPNDPVNLGSAPLTAEEIAARRLSADEVRLINRARSMSRLPRSQGGYYVGDAIEKDSNGFRKFEAYAKIIIEETGRALPVITTEGGVIPNTQEDPRYPKTTDEDVASQTVTAYRYMVRQAPDYYFAFMPWLIANYAAGNMDARWEAAAWFQGSEGKPAPVVLAVRKLVQETPDRATTRQATGGPVIGAAPAILSNPAAALTPRLAATPAPAATQSSAGAPLVNGAPALSTPRPGWVIFWRDDKIFNCVAVDLNAVERMLQAWQAPRDGHRWSMDIRDSNGKRLAAIGQMSSAVASQSAGLRFGPGADACPNGPAGSPPTPEGTPTPTPASIARKWDRRLDQLGIRVQEAPGSGRPAWKLIGARFEDETQSGGRHNIYIRLLDEQGRPTTGTATVSWSTGSYTMDVLAADLNRVDPYETYGANFPIYGQVGSYSVTVRGQDGGEGTRFVNGDTIAGLGMLGKQHVNYILIFQRQK